MTMIILILTTIIIKMTIIIDKTSKEEYSNSIRKGEQDGTEK